MKAFLVDTWLPAIRATVRATTFASYSVQVNKYLVPYIGHHPLQKLTAAHINAMYATLGESGKIVKVKKPDPTATLPEGSTCVEPESVVQGLSSNSIRRAHAALHRALADAVKWGGYLIRNVADAADPPRSEKLREMTIWSPEQLRKFVDTTKDERPGAMWLLFVTTGMRRGEVCGLKWADVDVEGARVMVRQIRVPLGREVMVGEPKTAKSRRTIPLDSANPLSVTVMFYDLTAKAGLPKIRLHEIRHSWATAALQAGINPKIVSERLGHAGVSITLDVYSSVTASMSEDAAVRVANLILG